MFVFEVPILNFYRDTFDYDDTDVTLPVEFDDIGYNDDEYIENFDK